MSHAITETVAPTTNADDAIMRYRKARRTIDSCVDDCVNRILPLCTPNVSGEVYKLVKKFVEGEIWQLSEDVVSALEGDHELIGDDE